MKANVNIIILVVSMLYIPIIHGETVNQSHFTIGAFNLATNGNQVSSLNLLARRGVTRSRSVNRRSPARRNVNRHTVHQHTHYRTIRGRRMRLFAVGAGIALVSGASCYVDNYGFGRVSGSKCCVSNRCYTSFYVD